jgi:tRNA(Ile)-lysidine synthase
VLSSADIPWFAGASKRRRYLVGVSGGADSVALLHLLVESGFRNLVVCHLDHRLRGRASTADARLVSKLAKKLGCECEIGRCDVRSRMKEAGESMETSARKARHEFFAECAKKRRCPRILLAHHADDQAETVLWNLLRGSHGFKGMREEHGIQVGGYRLQVIRPLLSIRHADLVEWLVSNGHPWREDASNLEPIAIRNRLRNEVFPLLNDISGRDAVAAFVRGAADATEHEDYEAEAVREANLLDPQGRIHLPAMRKLGTYLQRAALRVYLIDAGISNITRELLDRALDLTDPNKPAAINLPGGSRLRRSAGRIWVDRS